MEQEPERGRMGVEREAQHGKVDKSQDLKGGGVHGIIVNLLGLKPSSLLRYLSPQFLDL